MDPIRIVPFAFAEGRDVVEAVAHRIARRFRAETLVVDAVPFDPESCFSADRGQYHSTRLLVLLLAAADPRDGAILGVTAVDLFIPVLTYVFGEAQLDGRAAVVSTRRLDPRAYGLPYSHSLLVDRLEKEASHELGHARGLVHCRDARCVMSSSTYVEEIDLKAADFCASCWAEL